MLIPFCEINAQNENVILRAKTGNLSLEECRDWTLLEQNIDLFPSLLKLKDKLENDSILDCDNYFYIINLLSAYYSNRGDYYSFSLLLDDACEKFNEHAPSTNNEYLREIWSLKGKLEALLNNNDKALKYFNHYKKFANTITDQLIYYNNALKVIIKLNKVNEIDDCIEKFKALLFLVIGRDNETNNEGLIQKCKLLAFMVI